MRVYLKFLNLLKFELFFYFKSTYKQVKWRVNNSHNNTSISRTVKNSTLITVGQNSYGRLNVESYQNTEERLFIGNYVSIAENVFFILGGNHQIDCFTTFPLKAFFCEKFSPQDAQTKGPIIIEDEVWIGNNVVIMSGVKIGKGAIVAAGSVVVKNVEEFSIVAGNPARFIRWRIPENLINERSKISISNISQEKIVSNIDLFYVPLSIESLNDIKNLN